MGKIFNIAGPCNPEKHYMLPAMARLPEVMRLVEDEAYFVVHAQRQCGKTTAFLALANEINERGERAAVYCSLEAVQAFPRVEDGIPKICALLKEAVAWMPGFGDLAEAAWPINSMKPDEVVVSGLNVVLSRMAARLGAKQLVVFFDEVDCLGESTLITFLRQLRNGKIDVGKGRPFPTSVALIGMRNIRDYKARIRPERETLGSASPFNVITKAMTIRTFTLDEVEMLYRQHTDATGQIFESGCAAQAFAYSGGQPYLVNALAKWCVDEIHDRRYDETITLADIHEAKEKIIRERGTHLDSLLERMQEPRVRRIVEPMMLGEDRVFSRNDDDYRYVLDLGLLVECSDGQLRPANSIYTETIGRYLSRDDQDDMKASVAETPWVKDDGLDMQGLLLAFQDFWRENAGLHPAPFGYVESYPHIVLQAFLQRVINGGGEIIREMALGSGRLDLGVLFRSGKYAVEVKLKKNFEKNRERAYDQVCRYMDHLGQSEGWLVVFDPDLAGDWNSKLSHEDVAWGGKMVHLFRC